jgi:hypothetical protein
MINLSDVIKMYNLVIYLPIPFILTYSVYYFTELSEF